MATLTQWQLPKETKEWVGPLTVKVNGTVVTSFSVAVTEGTTRPTDWQPADPDPDGGTTLGVLVGEGTLFPLTIGRKFTIWCKFTDNPEIPVLRAGIIKVT